jgi:hypothetical protein
MDVNGCTASPAFFAWMGRHIAGLNLHQSAGTELANARRQVMVADSQSVLQ